MGRVVHFEIFTDEGEALADFYRGVFGWGVQAWESQPDYRLVETGKAPEPGIDGAVAPFAAAGDQRVVLTVDVADLDEAMQRAGALGATVVTDKTEVPGVGTYAYLKDPSGAVFGVMQSAPGIEGPVPSGEAGRDVWDEFGESLRQLGETVSRALADAATSPQAQRARDEAQRAAQGIRDASATAADKARPHVISALDRVSVELGNFASRLRRDEPEDAAGGAPMDEETTAGEDETVPPPDES